MSFFVDSTVSALALIVSGDPALREIVALSLGVSGASTALASLVGIPAGFLVAFNQFRGRRLLITLLNTLLALPTVVIGLFVYAFISRRGVFGSWELLYSPQAMVVGQFILIAPVIVTFTITAISRLDDRYRITALTLGATTLQTTKVVFLEARFGIVAAVILAFGRVISEVGISMMLGGNVKGFTRTITTAMALEYDKGEFTLSIALGIVLLLLSFCLNGLFNLVQGRVER